MKIYALNDSATIFMKHKLQETEINNKRNLYKTHLSTKMKIN